MATGSGSWKWSITTHLKIAKQLLTTAFGTCNTLDPGSIIDVFRYIVQWHMLLFFGGFYVARATCNRTFIYFMLCEMMQLHAHVVKSDDFSCIGYAQCINMICMQIKIWYSYPYQNLCNSKAKVIVPFSIKRLLNTLSSFWSGMGCLASWRRYMYIKNVRVQISFRGKGRIILFSGVEIHFRLLYYAPPFLGLFKYRE